MKIYIVTSGDYSDYGIRAVFSTRPAAKAFIKHPANRLGGEIEVWEAYDVCPTPTVWYVIERMWRRPQDIERRTMLQFPWDGPHFMREVRKAWNYDRWEYGERAWGTDEAAVEKVWKEQRAAQEALEAGL